MPAITDRAAVKRPSFVAADRFPKLDRTIVLVSTRAPPGGPSQEWPKRRIGAVIQIKASRNSGPIVRAMNGILRNIGLIATALRRGIGEIATVIGRVVTAVWALHDPSPKVSDHQGPP